ncbi:MAG: SPOR domain-containing protein [Muribaculaceae bacterium]|nr:SPOR domain-containing protein [Muribaculaceae bacterium]
MSSHRIKLIMIASMLGSMLATPLFSQTVESEVNTNVIERIVEESEGNIEIDIPESIMERLLTKPTAPKKGGNSNVGPRKPGIKKQQGYRVQVFSDGRNQGSLQARAKARGNAIASKFPKYRGQVYTFSSAPNWYTRVGNFESQSEANNAMAELKRAFPSFAGEMRVVKSQITLIK